MPITSLDNDIKVTIDNDDLKGTAKTFINNVRKAIGVSLGDAARTTIGFEENPIVKAMHESLGESERPLLVYDEMPKGSVVKESALAIPLKETLFSLGDAVPLNISLYEFILDTKQAGKESFLTKLDDIIDSCDTQGKKHDVDMSGVKSGLTSLKAAFVKAVKEAELPVERPPVPTESAVQTVAPQVTEPVRQVESTTPSPEAVQQERIMANMAKLYPIAFGGSRNK